MSFCADFEDAGFHRQCLVPTASPFPHYKPITDEGSTGLPAEYCTERDSPILQTFAQIVPPFPHRYPKLCEAHLRAIAFVLGHQLHQDSKEVSRVLIPLVARALRGIETPSRSPSRQTHLRYGYSWFVNIGESCSSLYERALVDSSSRRRGLIAGSAFREDVVGKGWETQQLKISG